MSRCASLPAAELVRDKGYEVLYLTDSVDEFALQMLQKYQDKEFKNVSAGDLGLESEEDKTALEEKNAAAKDLFEAMQKALNGKVELALRPLEECDVEVTFRSATPFAEDDKFFGKYTTLGGSLISNVSGTIKELGGKLNAAGSAVIRFSPYKMPLYGVSQKGRWTFGIYGRSSEGQYTIEVGGHSKGKRQLAGVADSYIAAADEEYVIGNKIPLWLFGFLY